MTLKQITNQHESLSMMSIQKKKSIKTREKTDETIGKLMKLSIN